MTDAKKAPRDRGADSPIARKRMARGLTQAQLAETVGCTQKDISRYEHARHIPNVLMLVKIAHALGCSVEDLTEQK